MTNKFVPLGVKELKEGCNAVTLATSEPWLRMVCTGTARGAAEMKYVGIFIDTLRAMLDQSYRRDEQGSEFLNLSSGCPPTSPSSNVKPTNKLDVSSSSSDESDSQQEYGTLLYEENPRMIEDTLIDEYDPKYPEICHT